MLQEARNTWVSQAREARGIGLRLSTIVDQMKDFASANGLSELITDSINQGSPQLIGTDMDIQDVLAYVQLSQDITTFLEGNVNGDGSLSRRLFMRKLG